MSYNNIILLLGTNLGDRNKNLSDARIHIEREVGEIIASSKIIETEAEDYESENLFLNQTLKVKTLKSPEGLLKTIKEIEQQIGRIYIKGEERYQDRLIDIDILLFNKITFDSQTLTIPHPQIQTRNFIKFILDCY